MRVLVVCARRYNGHELWVALGVLQKAGHSFEVVSTDYLIEDEVTGQRNTIERIVYEVDPEKALVDFHGLMIISGNMKDTEAYWDDKHVLQLVKTFNEQERPIAAICCSVPTVREAANGKRVSYYPLIRSAERLKNAGAILSNVSISVDGTLVTAEHQMATQEWAGFYAQVLDGHTPDPGLVESGFTPRGKERKPIAVLERMKRDRDE